MSRFSDGPKGYYQGLDVKRLKEKDIRPDKQDAAYWRKVNKAHKMDLEAKEQWEDSGKDVDEFKPEATLALQAYLKMVDHHDTVKAAEKPSREPARRTRGKVKTVESRREKVKPAVFTIEGAAPVITTNGGLTEVRFPVFPGWHVISMMKVHSFRWYPKSRTWKGTDKEIQNKLN